ncbi:MAG: efflux RND transporter periplasmic adaptor subunit [Desulfatitalea sp.]|nr:efflux RND transporter periplasmic adaptor subunit [Desulfatitalea sp.]NNJ99241.1 efflux RND transporter periplasmic adaptor subunit [Desulfatitalea sp.]
MAKRFIAAIIGLLVLLGLLAGVKGLQIKKMIAQGANFVPPPETVTTAAVQANRWESVLTAVGSLEAVQGITVTAEMTGKVVRISFEAGGKIAAGDLLVQQDTDSEKAQLRAVEATAELARINFDRVKKLLPERVVSQAEYDNAEALYTQAMAEADTIRAAMAKKTIRAPFSGRLGIRLINLGQVVEGGQAIVSLQSLDPIYANFQLPQQQLAQVRKGYTVRIISSVLPEKVVQGRITAINPEVDRATRNVRVQATLDNPGGQLRPGMFVNVEVVLPVRQEVLAIPATAVSYATYGNSVFVVAPKESAEGQAGKVVRQQIVEIGEKRGDFVAVRKGLEAGQTVVSTGVFKLRNGQAVVVDNTLSPDFKLAPKPEES